MRTFRRPSLILLVVLSVTAPGRGTAVAGVVAQGGVERLSRKAGAARLVGRRGERVPVLNEGGTPLQLSAVDTSGAELAASGWHSDSPEVALVDNQGNVRPGRTGFATILGQTGQGEAKCFVAVMRVTSQTGGLVQGDIKSDTSGTLYLSDPVHHVIVRASGLASERWVGAID